MLAATGATNVREQGEDWSEWMSGLSPATLEVAYEVLERRRRRAEYLEKAAAQRVVLETPAGALRLSTNYLLLPQKVSLREHAPFALYLTYALRRSAKEARQIVAEEEEAVGEGLGEAAPFVPAVSAENSLLDPGGFPSGMTPDPSNQALTQEFRNFIRVGLAEQRARPVGRSTLSLNFETPRGELGVTVDRFGLPVYLFSKLSKQYAESIVWAAREGARRMQERLREEAHDLWRRTFELADLAPGAPKFADLDHRPQLPGLHFSDEYDQERHDGFVRSLQEFREPESS